MQISKHNKSTLTLILGLVILLTMITQLYIMIAVPEANSPPQIVVGGIADEIVESQPQPPDAVAVEAPPIEAAEPPQAAVPEPQAEIEPVAESTEKSTVNIIPIIAIIVGAVVLVSAFIIGARAILKRQEDDEDYEDEDDEDDDEPDEQDEDDDEPDEPDEDDDEPDEQDEDDYEPGEPDEGDDEPEPEEDNESDWMDTAAFDSYEYE